MILVIKDAKLFQQVSSLEKWEDWENIKWSTSTKIILSRGI